MLFKRTVICGVLMAVSLASTAHAEETPPPSNEAVTRAQSLADKAYEAYERGDWSKAIAGYLESYRLAPAAAALFNIASIYDKKLNDGVLAVTYYRRYCASVDAAPDLVVKATDRISEIERAAKAAEAPREEKPHTAPAPAPSNSGATLRTLGYVSVGLGTAALAVASVYGMKALSQHDDAESAGCSRSMCLDAKGQKLEQEAASSANKSTVLFIASGALLSTGIALFLIAPKSTESKAIPAQTASLKLTPALAPDAAGVMISGTLF